ncbi:helix-turn-helix domain-containing protein [Desulfosporosinus metallidurans]|uniref:Transcriptional regulator, XRE family n=1 Tax=Desulfosporosinus metallidurans TaxID=1888891 RepID=A0A1Q8QRH1_9FIRM|nr:helix-turn-helix transcriptional regulator [Desulfosporosinus metallidurans]OLN29949.1 transcriptional regulator, XRE family [Desulfosporosinus metallidurans]
METYFLPQRLKNLREIKDLTQYDLAKALGFSRGQIANYEQGTRRPDPPTLQRLADYFGVSVDYLLGNTDKTQPNLSSPLEQQWPEGTKVLLRAHNKLTPEKKRKMLRLIETYINEEEDDED